MLSPPLLIYHLLMQSISAKTAQGLPIVHGLLASIDLAWRIELTIAQG